MGDFEFVNKIVGGSVPKQYIPAVEKGIQEAMTHGVLAGYPVINVKATLYDGKYHDVDSSEMAFKLAGGLAFREAIAKCNPVLLEPVMDVEVTVPDNYMGDVIGDLNHKRARILGMEPAGVGTQRVKAHVPMAEMGHYATALRSITQGRGAFRMQLLDYERVPPHVEQRIVERPRRVRRPTPTQAIKLHSSSRAQNPSAGVSGTSWAGTRAAPTNSSICSVPQDRRDGALKCFISYVAPQIQCLSKRSILGSHKGSPYKFVNMEHVPGHTRRSATCSTNEVLAHTIW